MRADREAAAAERSEMLERLASMPAAMRERRQWLLWKLEKHEGKAKPLKVPYYANGKRRMGKQGDEADRSALVDFATAAARLRGAMHYAGLGFAFLPGDGLIGVDIDGAIDPDTGEVSDMCRTLIESCASYAELSPSRRGVHIIVAGETPKFKDDPIGLEIYCSSQYFTCTGLHWAGSPREVTPIAPSVLAYMRELVEESKRRQAAEKDAAASVAPAPAAPAARATTYVPPSSSVDDFKRVNEAALRALQAWVPELLPKAAWHPGILGYRVTSKALGRELEEDLSIVPDGIMDWGTREGMTPIDLVLWRLGGKPKEALHWLADRLGLELTKRKLSLVSAPTSDDPRPEPPPPPHDDDQGAGADVVPLRGRKKKPPTDDKGGGGAVDRLLKNFALRYGTDEVWDGEQRTTMQVKNLRLVFGGPYVNAWLAHPERRLLYEGQIAFEPGKELPEGHVNLFDGFAMTPIECTEDDVRPMIDLARHLCSLSARTKEGLDRVYEQVMQWLAYPLQNPGAKLRFALVFHGPQGTGKNLFFDCVRSMYGKYGRMVGQTELEDKFNGYLSGKLMLIGNEVVTRQELFHHKNKLKWVITEPEIPIRGMHQEVRWESNHAQVVFLSNELQPVALEKDDRRHLVVYTPAAEDQDLYLRVADFLRNDGAAKWMYYLLKVDTEGFNEFTKPMMTEAKQALIDLGLKPAERFANEWLDGYLELPLQVCSAEQLYRVFRKWCDLNGERGVWVPQAQFTKNVERHVFERTEINPETGQRMPPRLVYKVVTLKHDLGPRKSVRCWLPRGTGPTGDQTEGEWAASAIASFELVASRFGRRDYEEGEGSP